METGSEIVRYVHDNGNVDVYRWDRRICGVLSGRCDDFGDKRQKTPQAA